MVSRQLLTGGYAQQFLEKLDELSTDYQKEITILEAQQNSDTQDLFGDEIYYKWCIEILNNTKVALQNFYGRKK